MDLESESIVDRDRQWPGSGPGVAPPPAVRSERAPMAAPAPIGFLLDATRRRRSGRIGLWTLVVTLFAAGVWLLIFPFVSDVWAGNIQKHLKTEFAAIGSNSDTSTVAEGSPLTRLVIPKLHVDVI